MQQIKPIKSTDIHGAQHGIDICVAKINELVEAVNEPINPPVKASKKEKES